MSHDYLFSTGHHGTVTEGALKISAKSVCARFKWGREGWTQSGLDKPVVVGQGVTYSIRLSPWSIMTFATSSLSALLLPVVWGTLKPIIPALHPPCHVDQSCITHPYTPPSRIRVLKLPRKCWAGQSRGSCSCVLVVRQQILNFLVGLTCLICPPLLILWKCCDMRDTLNGELTKLFVARQKKREAVIKIISLDLSDSDPDNSVCLFFLAAFFLAQS